MNELIEQVREALKRIESISATVNHAELYTAECAMQDLKDIRLTAISALSLLDAALKEPK